MKDILAQPIQIGHIQAKNRILMPPMYHPWSDTAGKVSDRHIAHYRERAEGGVGTIVVETTAVLREYRLSQSSSQILLTFYRNTFSFNMLYLANDKTHIA